MSSALALRPRSTHLGLGSCGAGGSGRVRKLVSKGCGAPALKVVGPRRRGGGRQPPATTAARGPAGRHSASQEHAGPGTAAREHNGALPETSPHQPAQDQAHEPDGQPLPRIGLGVCPAPGGGLPERAHGGSARPAACDAACSRRGLPDSRRGSGRRWRKRKARGKGGSHGSVREKREMRPAKCTAGRVISFPRALCAFLSGSRSVWRRQQGARRPARESCIASGDCKAPFGTPTLPAARQVQPAIANAAARRLQGSRKPAAAAAGAALVRSSRPQTAWRGWGANVLSAALPPIQRACKDASGQHLGLYTARQLVAPCRGAVATRPIPLHCA